MKARAWGTGLAGLVLLGILASGWTIVAPGEVVVVRRLGRALREPWGPGAHWGWPLGVDRTARLRLDEVRRVEFGRIEAAGPRDEPGEGEFLTGDRNLVRVLGVVQYRVTDPVAFVLRSADVDRLLERSTEASLARALAFVEVDAPLRSGRREVARQVHESLSQSVDDLGLGLTILGVNLTDARPPVEVEPAFVEAQAAQSGRDRRVNEARALAGTIRPLALAAAGAATDAARAKAGRNVGMARSQAERFLALLAEADRSRTLTVRRLYRDALRDLLPKVRRKILMTPDEPVDLGLFGPGSK
jgi:membrane protease subunit HflK